MNPHFASTDAELLVAAGELLFGPRWQTALARRIGEDPAYLRAIAREVREGGRPAVKPGVMLKVRSQLTMKADMLKILARRI